METVKSSPKEENHSAISTQSLAFLKLEKLVAQTKISREPRLRTISGPSHVSRRAATFLVLLILIILISPDIFNLPQTVKAQSSSQPPPFVGRVCLLPGDSTDCPMTFPNFPNFGGGRFPPGGNQLNVSINILSSTTFNRFDIQVRTIAPFNNASAIGVDLTGTVLPSPTVTVQCLNGLGLGCGSLDGLGIVHVAATGSNSTAPASGRLFKIMYSGVNTPGVFGFQTGCSISSIPNTNTCVLLSIGATADPESIQSQLLGAQLPTPLASVSPPGNITINFSGGSPTQPSVTFITPYTVTLPGTITTWKVQFMPGLSGGGSPVVPAGVQLKVLRGSPTAGSLLTVVAVGTLHDPRKTIQARVSGYPFFQTNQSVIEFFADTGIPVLPGDLIGITLTAPPQLPGAPFPFTGFFAYPGVTTTPFPARVVSADVQVNVTIDLNSPFTGSLECGFGSFCSASLCPCWTPALQVFVQVPPPPTNIAGDGIPDSVKLGPEMQAMGVDPCRKTVAVQLDYMVRPVQAAIDTVVASFDAAPVPAVLPCPYLGFPLKPSGVKLVIDVKNQIPFQSWLNFTQSFPMTFDYVKAAFFDPNRALYFHYGIFAHDILPSSSISGAGEIFGQNFMVTLGEWPNGGTANEQAGTIMHELGHNLGLDHGGPDAVNFKPNYLSVMNYAFQVTGIVSLTPNGGNVTRFDYSRQALSPLNESALVETLPLASSNNVTRWACPDGKHVDFGVINSPLDWNCDSAADTLKISVDINNDTRLEVLTGSNDWANLRYQFTQSAAFIGPGCSLRCNIGCSLRCNIGEEITFPQAAAIERQLAAFLASPHRSTTTSLNCSPASLAITGSTQCTATVTDVGTGTPITPTGIVGFTSSQPGTFTPSSNCSLAGSSASANCAVTYSPNLGNFGPQTISVAYVGDGNHLGSVGSSTVAGLTPVLNLTTNTTLTADVGVQVVIGADGITLNCNGHTINGVATGGIGLPSNIGINLTGRNFVTVQNCRAINFYIGFLLVNSNNNNLLGDTASGNGFDGFLLQASNNNNLVGDASNNNLGSGFRLVSSSNDNLKTNTANSNGAYGFALTSGSNNNTVVSNAACGNALFDALQSGSKQNGFSKNKFCTSQGI